MAALQPSMVYRIGGGESQVGIFSSVDVVAKQLCLNAVLMNNRPVSGLRSTNSKCGGGRVRVLNYPHYGVCSGIRCQFSSSDGGDRAAGTFDGGDGDFVNSSVIEAVEVKNGSDGFLIKMRDGRYLRCVYNHPKGGYPPDYISHPAIVLELEDGSGLVLPIIVLEMPSALLMAALCNVEMARPTVYQIVMEMIETMGYMVKYVRVTKRVHEAYFAELCVVNVNDENNSHCFDIRPSDAINIAVRCKAPIQVNKSLAHNDGLRIVEPAYSLFKAPPSNSSLLSLMDRPDGQPCPESEEFVLLRNMLIAAVEERYHDAAQWKDLLMQFRSRKQKRA